MFDIVLCILLLYCWHFIDGSLYAVVVDGFLTVFFFTLAELAI